MHEWVEGKTRIRALVCSCGVVLGVGVAKEESRSQFTDRRSCNSHEQVRCLRKLIVTFIRRIDLPQHARFEPDCVHARIIVHTLDPQLQHLDSRD